MPKKARKNSIAPLNRSKNYSRADRVGDVLHRVLAELIRVEFKDPRVGMVTVTSVTVTSDLKNAKVFVTVLEEEKAQDTVKILNQASGFFRRHVASSMQLRVVPKIQFIFDDSVIRGTRITTLLESCLRDL